MKEKDTTFTFLCPDCWENWTQTPPEKRVTDTEEKQQAANFQVGTDPANPSWALRKDRPFLENVARCKTNLPFDRLFVITSDAGERSYSYKPRADARPVLQFDHCSSCFKMARRDGFNRGFPSCGRCKVTLYCSVECQKRDLPEHGPLCKRFAEIAKGGPYDAKDLYESAV